MTAADRAPDLRVKLGALELENPILTASGTFGYGLEFAHLVRLDRLGGIVTKGLSPQPIRGNPPPRVCETRGGMLNSIGLQNIGIERFVADVLPGLQRYPAKVIVNVFGHSVDDYVRVVTLAERAPGIAALELNVSCPNVERGGIEFGHDPDALHRLVAAVRGETAKPLIVKMSPNVTSPVELGLAAKEAGADILSCINTVLGMAIDAATRRPLINTLRGGLSGPAIKPIALRIVFDVAAKVGLPVIGIGGIETATDVVEFLLAGASAVQIGTALFRDPRTPERLLDGLGTYLRESGTARVADLVGALEVPARRQRRAPKRQLDNEDRSIHVVVEVPHVGVERQLDRDLVLGAHAHAAVALAHRDIVLDQRKLELLRLFENATLQLVVRLLGRELRELDHEVLELRGPDLDRDRFLRDDHQGDEQHDPDHRPDAGATVLSIASHHALL